MNTVLDEWLEQVNSHPDKTCLVFSNRSFTYQQVEIKSNGIAFELKNKGIGEKSVVALRLERNEEIVFFILGILKAGAAYLFLDPNYPEERLKYMLDFVSPHLLITDNKNLEKEEFGKFKWLHINTFNKIESPTTINETTPSGLAYLMFTSGSTGRPKAVMMSHESVMTYLSSISELMNVKSEDVSLHTASFSFSSSVRQLLVPLINGCTLVIAEKQNTSSLLNLLKRVKQKKITIIDTVQSLWRYGLQSIESTDEDLHKDLLDNDLRLMVFSGDIFPSVVLSRINDLFGDRSPEIINLYGQTETIGGIAFNTPKGYSKHSGYVPIGKPLAHMKLFILDENLQSLPEGTPGEIYVSGKSLAQGYFKNPELTKQVFISGSTIGPSMSGTVFKTGDLGKINKQGDIEILGRVDFQVKIRGVRIELGEIESVLVNHPEISDAVVAAHERSHGDKSLVGYYIPADGSKIARHDIKKYLSRYLPEIMVPSSLMELDAFPLTPNGKINRKALPDPASDMTIVDLTPDMTNTEKNLWLIYRNLLGVDDISLTDSFFDHGGHSLLVVQLTEKIEQIQGKKIPISFVYEHPTVKELALELDQQGSAMNYSPMVNLQPFGSDIPFFYVHGDDSNYILPRILGETIPFYAFFHQGQDGSKLKYTTIESISSLYLDEILKIGRNNVILGGYSIGGLIAFDIACRLQLMGCNVLKLILIDSLAPEAGVNYLYGEYVFNTELKKFEAKSGQTGSSDNVPSNLFGKIERRLCKMIRKTKINFYRSTGKNIPLKLRNDYIMGIYRKARIKYKAGSFSGDIVLFRSTIDNFDIYDLGWKRFVTGKIDIYQIKSDHNTIIKLPAIQEIGEKIKEISESFSGK